jgi:tRNA(fMet)-specific endonuclease VapC
MMQYLLDTNICVFYLRGQLPIGDFVKGAVWRAHCCISEVTLLELYFGAENSNHPQKHHEAVDTFLEGVTLLPVSTCANIYAREKARFRKAGKPVNDEFDLIIGSTAVANELTLVTDNEKHFKNFENIKIENWFRSK